MIACSLNVLNCKLLTDHQSVTLQVCQNCGQCIMYHHKMSVNSWTAEQNYMLTHFASVSLNIFHFKHLFFFQLSREHKQVAQRATITHLSPMCQGQISFQKIRTHPSFNACSCYMKVSKGSNQKQQRKSGNTIFPIIRSMEVFLRRSRAANSVVGGPIWPKFELIHNIMHVLVTSKFETDRININRDYVMTSIF